MLGDWPSTSTEILEQLPGRGPYSWGAAFRGNPEQVATALARFVALLSVARDPQDPRRPLLHIESHLWIRPPSRLVRRVSARPAFGWQGEADPEAETTLGGIPRESLPAVYCRHCGGAAAPLVVQGRFSTFGSRHGGARELASGVDLCLAGCSEGGYLTGRLLADLLSASLAFPAMA